VPTQTITLPIGDMPQWPRTVSHHPLKDFLLPTRTKKCHSVYFGIKTANKVSLHDSSMCFCPFLHMPSGQFVRLCHKFIYFGCAVLNAELYNFKPIYFLGGKIYGHY